MATLFDENSNMNALAALNGVTAGPSTAAANAMNSNNLVNQLLSVKDSRWLQIEVCREYQRGQCSRNEQECKYAHPPAHVDVQNGRVTACYDSIKGRCTRENPKCKYLHPPQHLKDQLLQAGRNNLALKNLLCSQLTQPTALPTMLPGQIAHLVQQPQAQPQLMQALPFIPPYLTLPAGYPTLISHNGGGADPYQTANGNGPIPMKRSALDKNGIAVTAAQNQGLHIYAQHAAQFNPYLIQSALPGYIPVSFAGQLPPRF